MKKHELVKLLERSAIYANAHYDMNKASYNIGDSATVSLKDARELRRLARELKKSGK